MAFKPSFEFPTKPEEYASDPAPSLADWTQLWNAWDAVTRHMIPHEELLSKPIKLRNACIFYLGHIPTFLEIHLWKATGEQSEQLSYYRTIFERGIDPDVDDPSLCHEHSETPEDWPPAEEIYAYQEIVRTRVKSLTALGETDKRPAVRKALWLGFEHEAMHLETLLYMLVQSERTLAPPGVPQLDLVALATDTKARHTYKESSLRNSSWTLIPRQTVAIGSNSLDTDGKSSRYFGWDNEQPARQVDVGAFRLRPEPITINDYALYLEATKQTSIPASWSDLPAEFKSIEFDSSNSALDAALLKNKAIRTVFGLIPLYLVRDWPATASYDELAACAAYMGGRIPTLQEVRSIYSHVEDQRAKVQNRTETIPAVNSHLSNNGVEVTPPQNGCVNGLATEPKAFVSDLFVDLGRANVGFKKWHPEAIDPDFIPGQGELGGVWEWTSTALEKHEGFKPMELYPGYTCMLISSHEMQS
jgi:formylglycine-generating enzyme required for sulfatase activity